MRGHRMAPTSRDGPPARTHAAVRFARAATATLFLFVLSSCFTMALWGFRPETEYDQLRHEEATWYSYDKETKWSWPLLFGRILLTPFALGLDFVTAPVQAWLFGDDDEDEEDEKRKKRHRH